MTLKQYVEQEENLPVTQISIEDEPNCFSQRPYGGSCVKMHSHTDTSAYCGLHPLRAMQLWTDKNTKRTSHHDRAKLISILDCCPLRKDEMKFNFWNE